jgi:hypothetical protein
MNTHGANVAAPAARSGVALRRRVAVLGGLVGALVGCATMPIPGGKLVRRDYRPQVLVTYAADGEVAPGVRYSLVQQGPALAVFEQSGGEAGTVLERHWTDAAGDHFAVWATIAEPGNAVEVLIPPDRAQPAYRFVYPPGLYEVRNDHGIERPIPKMLIEASTQLRPVGPPPGPASVPPPN